MLSVTNEQKNAWNSETSVKSIRLYFPALDLSINSSQIYAESLEIKEAYCDSDSIEFVGCISHSMSVQVSGLDNVYKGEIVKVYAQAGNTDEIPLFVGVVDSVTSQGNKTFKKLVAYDDLFIKGNVDISAWYNNLTFPATLGELRRTFINSMHISAVDVNLPNDDVVIAEKLYDPKDLKALGVLRSFCQINGCFGIINRYGQFEFRYLNTGEPQEGLYPSLLTFPSSTTYPSSTRGSVDSHLYGYYRNNEYEEFEVKETTKVQIRQDENDEGQTYGIGNNTYIVQGNMWTRGLENSVLFTMARKILDKIKDVRFRPYKATVPALPYIECGDCVRMNTSEGVLTFAILSRGLKGIQAMRDEQSARGTEKQNIFISDLSLSVDLLKQEVMNQGFSIGMLDYRVTALEQGGAVANIVSTASLPANPDPNTLYCIQGRVVVN